MDNKNQISNPFQSSMKTYFACIIAVVVGAGIGIAVGAMRIASSPWEGLPHVEAKPGEAEPSSKRVGPVPKVAIDRLEYNFGTLDLEGKGREEFTVKNIGNAVLKLTKGETTCRCASSVLERSELAPGESTKIVLTWKPNAEPGSYEQSAAFYTNDPDRPKFSITISGEITATLRVQPTIFSFNRISSHETTTEKVVILNYLDRPLAIENPRFEENDLRKYFDATIAPLSEEELRSHLGAKNGFFLTVTVKPGLPQGAFKQTITITTDNPLKKEVAIPIDVSVGSEISVVGPGWDSDHDFLYLGVVKSQEGLSRRLLLVVSGPYRKEVRFKAITPLPVPLKITLGEPSEINDGQVVQTPLMVEIPPGSPQVSSLGQVKDNTEGAIKDEAAIELSTTHPEVPVFRIPVRFAVEK
jgi:hypothetical protein